MITLLSIDLKKKHTHTKQTQSYYIYVLEPIERGFQVDLNVAITYFLVVNFGEATVEAGHLNLARFVGHDLGQGGGGRGSDLE